MSLPGLQPKKKRIGAVWLCNFIAPGIGLGTMYACGLKSLGVLSCVWMLLIAFPNYLVRFDIIFLLTVALSAWGTIEAFRHNQAIEVDEELDLALHLPGGIADLDREIDQVSKDYVAAITDDGSSFALDTLEKKARDAEIRLKSMQAKLESISQSEANQLAELAQLPEQLGQAEEAASGPDTAASGLMSFAPLFETPEETSGLKLPLGREPEPITKSSSSPDSKSISFAPDLIGAVAGAQEEPPEPWLKLRSRETNERGESGREPSASNDDAVRAWLGTAGGAEQGDVSDDGVMAQSSEETSEPPYEQTALNSSEPALETPTDLQTTPEVDVTYEVPADPQSIDLKVAAAMEQLYAKTGLPEPPQPEVLQFESSEAPQAEIESLDEAVQEPAEPAYAADSQSEPTSLTVAGLDSPFVSASTLDNLDISAKSDFTPTTSTDYSNFLSPADKKVTEFVDKLATTIGGATAPQPTVDSAFEFSIPNFESSFSFDFSNALADVTDKEASAAAPKGANCCERCGSDRQSEFSFCLKCGISFST